MRVIKKIEIQNKNEQIILKIEYFSLEVFS